MNSPISSNRWAQVVDAASERDGARASGLWSLLLLAVVACAPAFYPGYWEGLEGFLPVFNLSNGWRPFSVAVSPDLWRGEGGAALVVARLLAGAGVAPLLAIRIQFVLCLVGGATGIYAWLVQRLGDWPAALAGIIYLFFPATLATVYIRGSAGELMILAFVPWALAGVDGVARKAWPRWSAAAFVLALVTLGLWQSQAGLASAASLLLLGYTSLVERSRRAGICLLAVSGLGFASLAPFWPLTAAPVSNFYDHFLYLFQFLGNEWQVAPSIPGWQDGYPFQLGWVATAAVIIVCLSWWRGLFCPQPAARTLLRFALLASLLLLTLSLNVSAPVWRLLAADRLFTYPWQLLLLLAPFYCAVAGALLLTLRVPLQSSYAPLLAGLVLLSSYPYLTTRFTQIVPPLQPVAVVGDNQLAILSANLREEFADPPSSLPKSAQLEVRWQVLRPLDFDYNIFFQAHAGAQPDSPKLAQLDKLPVDERYLPTGWQPGNVFIGLYQLDLPAAPSNHQALPANSPLVYSFGFYDWRNGVRLKLTSPSGESAMPANQDRLILYGQP
jgi:hypothetical protein